VLLEALVEAVTGEQPPRSGALAGGQVVPERARIAAPDLACAPHAGSDGEFELMFLLEAGAEHGARLRAALAAHGESVAVVGAAGMWQAHVHTDVPVRALLAGRLGPQRQVVVRHLALHAEEAVLGGLGVVAAVAEPGLVAQVARTGAVVHVPSTPPATPAELARAVQDAGARRTVVLAPDAGTLAAAHALAAVDPAVTVLEVRDGLHTVLALAELVARDFAAPEEAERALVAAAATVRTRRSGADGAPVGVAPTTLEEIVAEGAELVAVLHGARVTPEALARLEARALDAGAAEFLAL